MGSPPSRSPTSVEVAPAPEAWIVALTARPGACAPLVGGSRSRGNASLYKRACSMREGFDRDADPRWRSWRRTMGVPSLDPARSRPSSRRVQATRGLLIRGPREDRARRQRAEGSRARGAEERTNWRADPLRRRKGTGAPPAFCEHLRHPPTPGYGERLRYNEMLIAPTLDGHAMQAEPPNAARRSSGGTGSSPAPTVSRRRCLGLRGSGGGLPSATTSLGSSGHERLDALCASCVSRGAVADQPHDGAPGSSPPSPARWTLGASATPPWCSSGAGRAQVDVLSRARGRVVQ